MGVSACVTFRAAVAVRVRAAEFVGVCAAEPMRIRRCSGIAETICANGCLSIAHTWSRLSIATACRTRGVDPVVNGGFGAARGTSRVAARVGAGVRR